MTHQMSVADAMLKAERLRTAADVARKRTDYVHAAELDAEANRYDSLARDLRSRRGY